MKIAPLLLALAAPCALAQGFPQHTITLIVPTSTGTGPDLLARTLGPRLSEALGQPVVVDNREGAGTTIGTGIAAKAPADGHTILFAPNTLTMSKWLYKDLTWDAERDFAALTRLADVIQTLLVNPSVPAKTVGEFVAYAKQRPAELNYGTPGTGTPQHLGFELLNQLAGIQVAHIPYKGQAAAITDLVGGRVQAGIFAVQSVLPMVKAGKLRMLATAGDSRSPWTPDVPTFAESGIKGLTLETWVGAFVPRATPAPVVDRLSKLFVSTMNVPEVKEQVTKAGMVVNARGPAELDATVREDVARWGKVMAAGKTAGS